MTTLRARLAKVTRATTRREESFKVVTKLRERVQQLEAELARVSAAERDRATLREQGMRHPQLRLHEARSRYLASRGLPTDPPAVLNEPCPTCGARSGQACREWDSPDRVGELGSPDHINTVTVARFRAIVSPAEMRTGTQLAAGESLAAPAGIVLTAITVRVDPPPPMQKAFEPGSSRLWIEIDRHEKLLDEPVRHLNRLTTRFGEPQRILSADQVTAWIQDELHEGGPTTVEVELHGRALVP